MKNLMATEDRETKLGAKKRVHRNRRNLDEFREKVADPSYLDHAIKRIATDLTNYLTK